MFSLLQNVAPVITFAVVLGIYINTVQLGIPGGDSGELVAEACQNGCAHPPGYPLFTALNYFAIKLNITRPALATNHLSCLFGAFAACNIAATVSLFTKDYNWKYSTIGSFVAGISYACMNLQWLYSIGSEVFALNNCLCTWIIYFFARYMFSNNASERKNNMLFGAFVCGLCLSNQHTSILYLIPLIVSILYDNIFRKQEFTGSIFLQLILFGMVGLSPYLLLYRNTIRIGSWGDTSNIQGLLTHILRREYGTFSLSPSEFEAEGLVERTIAYFADTQKDIGMVGFILTLLGFLLSLLENSEQHRYFTITIGVCFLFYIVVFHTLSNLPLSTPMPYEVHRRFWMQPNIIISLFLGLGLSYATFSIQALVALHANSNNKSTNNNKSTKWKSKLKSIVGFILLILSPFYLVESSLNVSKMYSNMTAMNGPDGRYFERFGVLGLKCASGSGSSGNTAASALLISTTDINWNSMRYLQTCEGMYPNLIHVSLQIAPFPWFQKQQHLYQGVVFPAILSDASMQKGSQGHTRLLSRFLESNINRFKGGVFIDLHSIPHESLDANNIWQQKFQFLPQGLLWKVEFVANVGNVANHGRLDIDNYIQWQTNSRVSYNNVRQFVQQKPSSFIMFPGSWEEAAVHIATDALYQRALYEISYAVALAGPGWLISASKTQKERDVYLTSLSAGFIILRDITNADSEITTALNSKDVNLNLALCSSRLTFHLATSELLTVSGHSEMNATVVAGMAIEAVEELLRTNKHAAFQQILPLLIKTSGLKIVEKPQKSKKMKRKKKRKKKNRKK